MPEDQEDLEAFRVRARRWLEDHAEPRPAASDSASTWGSGSDDLSVFHDVDAAEERAVLDRLVHWHQLKLEAGFAFLELAADEGGVGLTAAHEEAFRTEERAFATPPSHELFEVTLGLIAPTVRLFGTDEQRRDLLPRLLRAEDLACQLFSEPGAGSDLAALGTRAVRDGDAWVVNGQKVWTSGAHLAQWGELIARTDPEVPKHAGMTAFVIPLDLPGVTVRPLRQMSGGSSFNEVFLDDVRVPDSCRLGEVGDGWKVTLTTLGFERGADGPPMRVGGGYDELLALARWLGRDKDPVVRQRLADVYAHERIGVLSALRAEEERRPDQPPGPEGSIKKLHWVRGLAQVSEVAAMLLGNRLVADTGEWGTFAWTAHVLGAPGYRIAGGSDEVQRTILGERVLGLPAEPRADRGLPWRESVR